MKYSHTQFKIDQLRKDKMILGIESIAVFVFSLFLSAFLPQLVFQYFYADQQLLEEPIIFQYIPVAAFAIGVGYFLYATILVLRKAGQVKKLEKDLEMMANDCCCGGACGCDCDQDDMEEMQVIVDELLQETAKPKAKSAAKASKKKTAAKKKSTKKSK